MNYDNVDIRFRGQMHLRFAECLIRDLLTKVEAAERLAEAAEPVTAGGVE